MKYRIRMLGLGLVMLFNVSARGGDNVMDKLSNGVCDCLETCKKDESSIKGNAFQGCVQKVAKPYMKDLKKLMKSADDEDFDQDLLTKLAMQLGISMSEKCPAMLQFILEEMPELLEDN